MRFLNHKPVYRSSTLALLAGVFIAGRADGAEHITLTNGFDVICNHHALVEIGRAHV